MKTLNATPHKRFIYSLVSDYNLTRSICELIDNALDLWTKNNRSHKLTLNIDFDSTQKTITIRDNAGGVEEKHLEYLVSPGGTTNQTDDLIIGFFGVGTKRAVIALSEDVKIFTRFKKGKTFKIVIDQAWLSKDDWHLDYDDEVKNIEEGSTLIELQKLRISTEQSDIDTLRKNLSSTYAKFLANDNLKIFVNATPISPVLFDNWAYPPDYKPILNTGIIKTKENREVAIEIYAGLITESSPATGEYGVYFYCNERLIVSGLKNAEVGFIPGYGGTPHPEKSIFRIIISLRGSAIDMPWNSSKSDINSNHYIFNAFRIWLFNAVKTYASLSTRLVGHWPDEVFKYTTGEINQNTDIDFYTTTKSYLPELPKVNVRYVDKVKSKNAKIEIAKIWITGIYEGVVAVRYLSRQKLQTKNRISLIILDSTLEIAFKEYLVRESGHHYSNGNLITIFGQRHNVELEVQKYITTITPTEWGKIKYYYDLRCKLVHERATIDIPTDQLEDYNEVVETVLNKLFKLRF